MSLITCENLTFAYEGVVVLRDLNFKVEQGNYLCIIGENGAGKSTLMKGLLRLKKPSSGTLRFGDGLKPGQIGYLPQQTQVQMDFPASVEEVVMAGCLSGMGFWPFFRKKEREKAMKNMRALEIEDLRDKSYRDLSGGQQQRVLLARALCATGKLLLLDEPAAGLDPVVTASMYRLIENINRDMGITVIMVSHDLQAALRYATHILHLGEDRQLFFGKKEDYRRSAACHSFMGETVVHIRKQGKKPAADAPEKAAGSGGKEKPAEIETPGGNK